MATRIKVTGDSTVIQEEVPDGQRFMPLGLSMDPVAGGKQERAASSRATQAVANEDGTQESRLAPEDVVWLAEESRECKAGDLDLSAYVVTGRAETPTAGTVPTVRRRAAQAQAALAAAGGASVNSAAARLAKARSGALARGESRFERYETSKGEVFYIKRLSWPQVTRVHLESGLGLGILDIEEGAEGLTSFTASVLEACVYAAPEEDAKYFTQTLAKGWVESQDEELGPLVGELNNACLNFNRMLLPKFYWTRPAASVSETSQSQPSPETSTPSSNSTSTSTPTGSTPTASNEPPATSPTDSEAPPSCEPTVEESPRP